MSRKADVGALGVHSWQETGERRTPVAERIARLETAREQRRATRAACVREIHAVMVAVQRQRVIVAEIARHLAAVAAVGAHWQATCDAHRRASQRLSSCGIVARRDHTNDGYGPRHHESWP